ncbi:MAG: flagellin [Planctomycetia bacterium]|jgi:flagellin-like hook-associated protein FlgL
MTRINTNVSSLQAQINLSRNNEALQTALTRLSTGLRINSGKDDPAGLIASESLRRDIAATGVGISNSQMANQMIATADSALGQVSSLLIDIQSLVNEAANSGTMSAAQIAANQLQIDSSLDAIDRIGQSTQFQGNTLLDGSLSFITESVNSTDITSVQIDQANFGTNPTIGVNVELLAQATKGSLTYESGQTTEDVVLQVGGVSGFQAFNFDAGTSVNDIATAINLVSDATGVTAEASGVLEWDASAAVGTVASYGANNDLNITANTTGEAAGSYYVRYFEGAAGGSNTSATITEAQVDAQTGEVTFGYIDVTLGTSATGEKAVYDNVVAGLSAGTSSNGVAEWAGTNITGTFSWVARDSSGDSTGNMGGPTFVIAAGAGPAVATAEYELTTNTYTVTVNAGIADVATLEGLLNNASGGKHQFDMSTLVDGGVVVATDTATNEFTEEGTNGYVGTTAPVISAIATTDQKETTPMKIVFTDSAVGGAVYTAGTNTYTVDIDNSVAGAFTMTGAELEALLDGATGVKHAFTVDAESVFTINAINGDVTLIEGGVHATFAGLDADDIDARATDVIDAINTAQDNMITAGTIASRIFTVENASGNDGSGIVGISDVTALTGTDPGKDPTANNMLQYQALEGMRDIQYVASGTNTALSIDLDSDPEEYVQAAAIVDLGFANGTFEIRAQEPGFEGNHDIYIKWEASGDADTHAIYDADTHLLTIQVATDDTNVNEVIAAINSSATAGSELDASLAVVEYEPGHLAQVGDGTGAIPAGLTNVTDQTVTLTGGVVNQGTMIVNLATDANGNVTTTANDLISFIEASDEQVFKDFELQVDNGGSSNGTGTLEATTSNVKFAAPGTTYSQSYATGDLHAANGSTAQITVTAQNLGTAYDGILVRVAEDLELGDGEGAVTYNSDSRTLLVTYNGAVTANTIVDLINTDTSLNSIFAAEATAGAGGGTGNVLDGDFVRLTGGEVTTTPDGLADTGVEGAPMVELLGGQDAGEETSSAMLTFNALNYGSSEFVSVKSITGSFVVKDTSGSAVDRAYGTDVSARINGLQGVGDGLNVSLSSASLQLQLGINELMEAGDTTSFSITGGGAQFQLGPQVVSNQQARIGIMSVSTATLGGINGHGRLYQLRNGESYDLATDTTGASAIVTDVITQVTGLRGKLGAFQKTTLETNIATLEDTLETLTAAESMIRDTDFAAESSNLTRAQILVQSSTSVLAIANQQPQSVLSLIQ